MKETQLVDVTLAADEALENGMGAWRVQADGHGGGVILYDVVLVEDDAPGAAMTDEWVRGVGSLPKASVLVQNNSWAKKVFHVERPEALGARLLDAGRPHSDHGRKFRITFNGRPIDTSSLEVPVSCLKKGDNEVLVRCERENARRMNVAPRDEILRNAPERKGRPPRSFRSMDGGKTWRPVDGEYWLRLRLQQYVEQGSLVSPVIDLGRREQAAEAIQTKASVRSVALSWNGEAPRGAQIDIVSRTGPGPVYDPASWTGWRKDRKRPRPGHRYLQWKAVLKTSNPLATPVLRSVTVRAQVERAPKPKWADTVTVRGFHNEEIRYTSIPFEYEDVTHPRLRELRERYGLDKVVKGAKTDLEKAVRLRNWVAKQWRFRAPSDPYPAWDALEILARQEGFCVQYAIVHMQCCLALGLQARFVFGINPGVAGGHEVTEVWSNELGKWMYMDGSGNFHHVDPKTNVPFSMLEVHDLILKTYCKGQGATQGSPAQRPKKSTSIATCRRLEMKPQYPQDGKRWRGGEVPRKWLHVWMMPRSNFLSKPRPVPPTQGRTWRWTDYWLWEDRQTPRRAACPNVTARRADLDWTINQVRFAASYGRRPNSVDVSMGTVTPSFEAFMVRTDQGQWRDEAGSFAWRLRPGLNRLEMRVRNKAGVLGPVSFIELERG